MDVTSVTALAASVHARSYLFSGARAGALSAISFALIMLRLLLVGDKGD